MPRTPSPAFSRVALGPAAPHSPAWPLEACLFRDYSACHFPRATPSRMLRFLAQGHLSAALVPVAALEWLRLLFRQLPLAAIELAGTLPVTCVCSLSPHHASPTGSCVFLFVTMLLQHSDSLPGTFLAMKIRTVNCSRLRCDSHRKTHTNKLIQ